MKKIVLLTLMALGIPLVLGAQNVNNDLYYVPSSKKEVKTQDEKEVLIKDRKSVPSSVIVKSSTPVVGSEAPIDDVDAYNRRSSTYGNPERSQGRSVATTTTTRQKTRVYDDGLDGEWVNGFNGTVSDYEYATRIIRFRNPRFAISISSPLYWDVVYGLTAWDWNVYVDGLYAYAFPTYTNRLWWDWHWGSIGLGWGYGWPYYGYNWGWGWNSWYSPWHSPWYYSSWGWGGCYSPYYSWGWHSGWGWGGGYYAYGHPHYGGWGYGHPYSYNNRRNDLGVGSAGRNLFGRSTRTTSSVARDANGRTGGRVVSGSNGVNTRTTTGTSSRVARRATTSTGVGSGTTGTGINTRSATTRRSVGTSSSSTTTTSRSSSTGVNRTYSTSSSRMNSRTGGSSVGTSTPTRSTTTRSYGNSSSRSYSSGGGFSGGSSGGGFSGGGASTRSSGGGVSSGGGGGGARRR